MRTGVTVYLSPTDRKRLQAIVDDRNNPQKHVWRARIVLATARRAGHGDDHAHHWRQQDGRLALAGAVHVGGC
jgi:hypothetical protein